MKMGKISSSEYERAQAYQREYNKEDRVNTGELGELDKAIEFTSGLSEILGTILRVKKAGRNAEYLVNELDKLSFNAFLKEIESPASLNIPENKQANTGYDSKHGGPPTCASLSSSEMTGKVIMILEEEVEGDSHPFEITDNSQVNTEAGGVETNMSGCCIECIIL